MNSTGVLDDYLDELLGEAIVATPPSTLSSDNAGPCPTSAVAPEREPTWDDLPSEVIYETDAVVAQPAADNAALEAAFDAASTPATVTDTEREPTWDDLPAEVIYETGTVAPTAEDTAALEAAFEAATSGSAGPRPASEAAAEREPTWDDVPDEVVHETAPALAPVTTKAGPEPTWDDLPDEVIYETDAADSHHLAHTDSPGLQAAFEAAAGARMSPRRRRPWSRPGTAPCTCTCPGGARCRGCPGQQPSRHLAGAAGTGAPARQQPTPTEPPRRRAYCAGCACAAGPRRMHWNC